MTLGLRISVTTDILASFQGVISVFLELREELMGQSY